MAAVGEGGLGRLPAVAERVLVCGQLVEQVVGALPVDLSRGLDQRPRLVQLEAIAMLTPDAEAQVLAAGRILGELAVANGAVEDLGEQVQVGVDRARLQLPVGSASAIEGGPAACLQRGEFGVLALLVVDVLLDEALVDLVHAVFGEETAAGGPRAC